MKRLVAVFAVLTLVGAVPLTHFAAAEDPAKVDVCHVNSANPVVEGVGGLNFYFGRVISISEADAADHIGHGDSTFFLPVDDGNREFIEKEFEVSLRRNVNCYFPKFSVPELTD